MRTRSSTTLGPIGSNYNLAVAIRYVNQPQWDNTQQYVVDTSGEQFTKMQSAISDTVMGVPENVYVDPTTGKWRRIRRHRPPTVEVGGPGGGLMHSQLKPVLPCEHQKTIIRPYSDLLVAYESHAFAGDPVYDKYDTRTYSNMNGLQVLKAFGYADVDAVINSSPHSYTESPYLNHDWFALADSFSESCDQFLHSSSLVGESILQPGIFIDALKLVINPTSAIGTFIKYAKRLKKYRKLSLGQASKQLLKGSANANLTYQFGVKPAISEIRSALDAHKRVSSRLAVLRSNAGRYIPIRVKDELHSSFDNEQLETDDAYNFQWSLREKFSLATVGGWGRVRSDLQFTDTWNAYLQYFGINKMAGLVWELIPLSFVVDWFTNTQERINYYTRMNTTGPFEEICNLWSSVKQSTTSDLNLVPGRVPWFSGASITDPSSALPLLEKVETNYTRQTFIPESSGVLDFSAIGLFHAITSGSLILQKWR